MIVYTYDYASGAYLGEQELTVADIDPRTHSWLIPGNATVEPPPRCDNINCVPLRRNGKWVVYEIAAEIPDPVVDGWRQRIAEIFNRQNGVAS